MMDECQDELVQRFRTALEAESRDGVMLLTSPEDNPICSISVDHSIPAVLVVWKGYATSAQLRFIHEHMLCMVKKHGVRKILGDDTALPTIHMEDRVWINEEWMPRAVAAGVRAGASKRPQSYFGKLSIEHVLSGAPENLTIRAFDEFDDARHWLCQFAC